MFDVTEGVIEQPPLLEIPEQPDAIAPPGEPLAAANKYIAIDRRQMMLIHVDVENLISADHKARAMWELTGRLDLSAFERRTKSVEGEAGRPAWSPHLLLSVWLYAYSEGITSARGLARRMESEPALQWLSGLEQINHHTLSSFRVNRQAELDALFVELHALEQAELISLERVMHDGTKIRARAGVDSCRREQTLNRRRKRSVSWYKRIPRVRMAMSGSGGHGSEPSESASNGWSKRCSHWRKSSRAARPSRNASKPGSV